MSTQVMIRDELSIGGHAREWPLQLPEGSITVRELLRRRVRAEVEAYNTALPEVYQGLIQPGDAEAELNGYRMRQRKPIDGEKQFERALKAFEGNQILVLLDDYQVGTLEEHVEPEEMSKVTFLRLVPLVGG